MAYSSMIWKPTDIGYTAKQDHNSKVAVNKVNKDILYYIFVSTVDESPTPLQTALTISHVCRHWRNSALGWPILWRFLDLNFPVKLLNLCLTRSKNVPLNLSWPSDCDSDTISVRTSRGKREKPIRLRDPSYISRLSSLTLHLSPSQFNQIRHILRNPDVPPFQPRQLDICGFTVMRPKLLTDLMRIEFSRLEELRLYAVGLPWLKISCTVLTRFRFWFPKDPPPVSCFLKFLSNCPLLCKLELIFDDVGKGKIDKLDEVPMKSRTILPKLKQLQLQSWDVSSYIYYRALSSRIRSGTALCEFFLLYDNRHRRSVPDTDTTTRDIFEAIPSGLFSNFASHRFLHISVKTDCTFQIASGFFTSRPADLRNSTFPFKASGSFPKTRGDSLHCLHTTQNLVRAMPGITCLSLDSSALFLPWVASLPSLFPHLETLYLDSMPDMSLVLSRLPAGLKLNKLILMNHQVSSVDAILSIVLSAEARYLKLANVVFHARLPFEVMQRTLQERNVVLELEDSHMSNVSIPS